MDDPRDHFGAFIGDTPLLELRRFGERRGLRARILAKIEALNPAGSIKDRTAWGIVQAAEAEGRLVPGQLLVELTSGNTGIGLAALAAARGYRAKFYLRTSTSHEKVTLIERYGAETVPIDDAEFLAPGGVDAIIDRVRRENPDAFYTDQRANPANPASTTTRPAPRSGVTRTVPSTSSSRRSGPAARSPAPAVSSRQASRA